MNICIVEDDRGYRESLELLFSLAGDMTLAASFAAPNAYLRQLIDKPSWDLVVMDLDLPVMDGVEAIRRTRATHPDLPVVVLTAFDDPPRILAAIRAGADGYLLKNSGGDELITYLRDAVTGGSPLTPGVARSVLDLLRGTTSEPRPNMSPREHDVLRLLVKGLAYKQIAAELGVSIDTVRTYVRTLYKKLRVHSATEAVSKALRQGWVQ